MSSSYSSTTCNQYSAQASVRILGSTARTPVAPWDQATDEVGFSVATPKVGSLWAAIATLTWGLSSAFANNFAVSSIAETVVTRSPNCFQLLSIEALPSRVSPAKQKSRCVQKT